MRDALEGTFTRAVFVVDDRHQQAIRDVYCRLLLMSSTAVEVSDSKRARAA